MLYWLRASENYGPGTILGFPAPFLLASVIAIVILTEFMDFVVLFKVALVAIFPNVATAGIEERVVPSAIRELDTAVGSVRHGGLGLNDWFQYAHRKKQSDECEDHLRIQVNAHVRPPFAGQISVSANYKKPKCCRLSNIAHPLLPAGDSPDEPH
jgi:hypothetical protein